MNKSVRNLIEIRAQGVDLQEVYRRIEENLGARDRADENLYVPDYSELLLGGELEPTSKGRYHLWSVTRCLEEGEWFPEDEKERSIVQGIVARLKKPWRDLVRYYVSMAVSRQLAITMHLFQAALSLLAEVERLEKEVARLELLVRGEADE